MTHESKPYQFEMTLKDQEFLKELGISGMPSGRESLLRHQDALKKDLDKVKQRADQLQSLDLADEGYEQWAEEDGGSGDELREKKRFFRDLED